MSAAVDTALSDYPDADSGFTSALKHSADVFAAFKVHSAQRSMAAQLLTPDGSLKPFEQWANDVLPIASHQFGPWLRTEYDTAILRARQAADWQRFERNKDIMPNLRWVPSTSAKPGADHRIFWGTVLPIDHQFWSSHRPGDRWNCKCSLEATDEPTKGVPQGSESGPAPQAGLKSNPGTSRQLFDNSHPYFPDNCSSCPFGSGITNALRTLFTARKKDCCNCARINSRIQAEERTDGFKVKNKYPNGGELLIHEFADKSKADYKAIVNIAQHFAKSGEVVRITPAVHRKSEEYHKIYGSLIGTKYENKCPDFQVGDKFYEFEGFQKPWNRRKVSNMLSHGLKQSDCIVIDNTCGASDRIIRKAILSRLSITAIREVWLYEKGNCRLFFSNHRK